MLKVQKGPIFVNFALTRSSVSIAGLVLEYFTRPAGQVRLKVSFTHCDGFRIGVQKDHAAVALDGKQKLSFQDEARANFRIEWRGQVVSCASE